MKNLNSPFTGKPMRIVYEPGEWKVRGEYYPYIHIAYRDEEKGKQFTTDESDTACYFQATNQYRERHGIPYRDEIVALRERYGVSATKMAMILGFGTNQYRLYEMGEVPSESNGKMIRSAMTPHVFLDLVRSTRSQLTDKEYAKIITRVDEVIKTSERRQDELKETKRLFRTERGMANGFAPLSTDRLKNLLLYLLQQMGETSPNKMNEVLFYIDFFSYRERGMAISGLAYQSLELGPVPQRWDRVYSAFDEVEVQLKLVQGQELTRLKADVEADMGGFSAEEMAVIDTVCEKMKGMTSKEVAKMCGEEPAWKNHLGMPDTIPFVDAFTLIGM